MKIDSLKAIIKETMKEAIQEELKDILLEAVKSGTGTASKPSSVVSENVTKPSMPKKSTRQDYMNVINETAMQFNSNDVATFRPSTGDVTNGNLGSGAVSMDQIMGLMNK